METGRQKQNTVNRITWGSQIKIFAPFTFDFHSRPA